MTDITGTTSYIERIVYIPTPIGTLRVIHDTRVVESVTFTEEAYPYEAGEFNDRIKQELDEYFRGERKEFTLPVRVEGSVFQCRVLELVQQIPYGETRSYGDLSRALGKPGTERAVGGVNSMNRLLLLVPCHRVIGGNGKLTGYSGGVDRKRYLLEMERGVGGRLF